VPVIPATAGSINRIVFQASWGKKQAPSLKEIRWYEFKPQFCGRKAGRGKREYYSKTKEKPELGNVTWRPEEGHLTLEVKTVNEITSDYVWDKLYTPPHFCNLL
jgi:hypothetical protein